MLIFVLIFVLFNLTETLRVPQFPKYKGHKVANNYKYKEYWYPQTVCKYLIHNYS